MKIALFVLVLILGALYAYGDVSKPKHTITLKAHQEGRFIQVTVTLPQVDPSYRWLGVHVCEAEFIESGYGGAYVCTGWARESSLGLDGERSTYFIEWRDPRGRAVLITAQAFDVNGRTIAKAHRTLFLKG